MTEGTERERFSRILIVEDEESQLRTLADLMEDEGFVVIGCPTATAALEHLQHEEFGVAVVDLHLPDLSGTQLLEKIKAQNDKIRFIVHTGHASFDSAKEALNLGAFAYVEKGGDPSGLIRYVHAAARWHLDRYAKDLELAVAARTAELRESEERYRAIAENMPVLICRFLPGGKITYVNQAYCEYFAQTPKDLIGSSILQLIPEADRETVMANISALTIESPTESHEHPVIAADGETRWQRWTNHALFDARGMAVAYQSIGEDITARKRVDEAMRLSEDQFSKAFHSGPMLMAISSVEDGTFLEVNENFERVTGFSREEAIGTQSVDLGIVSREDRERMRQILTAEGKVDGLELKLHTKSGDTRWILFFGELISIGEKQKLLTMAEEITERRQVEQHLRDSEERYRSLVNNIDLGICLVGTDHQIVMANTKLLNTFSQNPDNFIGQSCFKKFRNRDSVCPHCPGILAMATGKPAEVEIENGTSPVRLQAFPVFGEDGTPTGFIEVAEDITARLEAEEALRESEARFRNIFENTPIGIYRTTPDGQILMANPAIQNMLGYTSFEELAQHNLENEGFHASYPRSEFKRKIEKAEPGIILESAWARQDGSYVWVREHAAAICDTDGTVLYYEGTAEDITERVLAHEELAKHREHLEELVAERSRELEESHAKLHRTQRLASLGTLAAGIAHEINNPLGLILLSAQRAISKASDPEIVSTSLHRIKDDVKRCAHIVKSVLLFSRDRSSDRQQVAVDECVRRSDESTREYAMGQGVQVQFECAGDLPAVAASPIELEQALVNLIYNAVEASNAGQLVMIRVERSPKGVRVTITDQGRGMAAQERERAFDPFFTTRQQTGGTGLGLSIVYGIITDQGGTVEIDSQPGQGTKVTIELPVEDTKGTEE